MGCLEPSEQRKIVSKEQCNQEEVAMRTEMPNGGEDLLGEADMARAPNVATITVKTRSKGEMLTSTSQLLHNLSQGYARAIR
jgi:hypothetical protein